MAMAAAPNPDARFGSKADLTAPKSDFRYSPESGLKTDIALCPFCARFGHASSYRREVAPTASGQCDLRTVFPKVISGLRRPIAIQAAISLNMNLPE